MSRVNKESENKLDSNNNIRKESSTPMLDRMFAVKELSETCGDFLEWLMHRYDIFDPKVPRETLGYIGHGDYINKEQVLADFFSIDLEEAEKEKEMILRNLQKEKAVMEHHCKLCGTYIEENNLKVCDECEKEYKF